MKSGYSRSNFDEGEETDSGELLDSLYNAVIAPEGFQQFIEKLAAIFQLKGVALVVRHIEAQDTLGLWLHGIEPEWMRSYTFKYGSEDMLAMYLERSPIGQFYASNLDLPSPARFQETRFFREWAEPQGVAYAAASVVMREGPWLTVAFLQRSPAQPPFSREEMARFNRLIPHWQRATQMRQRLSGLHVDRNFLAASLNAFAVPIVLFDEQGRIVHENMSASALLDKGDAIHRADGRLMTSTKASTRALHLELGNVIRSRQTSSGAPAGLVLVERPGARPLTMMILPMQGTGHDAGHDGALLFAFDPDAAPSVTAALLQRLFGFTAAEGELAVALCAGSSPEEIAAERSRSISTVRNQIRSLYAKTGAQRQSDLVGLLLASPAYFIAKEHSQAAPLGA